MYVFLIFALLYIINLTEGYTCDVPEEWLKENDRNFAPYNIWPQGVVKYEFNSSMSAENIEQVRIAFSEYHNKTCIRFEQRSIGEAAYVSIENDPDTCGVAHLCRTGGYQYAKFGGTCTRAQVMVHELGHTLCYGHEQARKDRDEYINFPGCELNQIPGKNENYDIMGSMYDYASQMHYSCQRCSGGWPTMPGAASCGDHVSGASLSVLDVNKLNALYDCQGCLSYRFRNFKQLTAIEKLSLFPGGFQSQIGETYVCRSYHMGDIIPGVFNLANETCQVGYNAIGFTEMAGDVLLNPSDAPLIWTKSPGTIPENAIAGGRTASGETIYIGRGNVTVGGTNYQLTGKIHQWNSPEMNAALNGVEYTLNVFDILTCSE